MAERKRRVFPDAFKREAVERVRTSGMTIIAVAEEVGCMGRCFGGGSRDSAAAPPR